MDGLVSRNILLTLRIKDRWFPSIEASGAAFLIVTMRGSAPLLGPDEPASGSLRKGANGNWIVLSVSARSPACLSFEREKERERERVWDDGAWQASCVVSRYSLLPDRAHNVDVMFITGSVRCFRMSRRFWNVLLSPIFGYLSECALRVLALSYVRFTSNVKRFRHVTPYYVSLEWLSLDYVC